jgi:hypothetical protein
MRPHHRDEPLDHYRRRDSGPGELDGEASAPAIESAAAAAITSPGPPPHNEDSAA